MKTIIYLLLSLIFLFNSCTKFDELAIVKTSEVSNITESSATCGGVISVSGGSNIIARGLCYSINENPSINDTKTSKGDGLGSFIDTVTGLLPNTVYYIRAYATNSSGASYGEAKKITTQIANITLTTSSVSNITSSTATCGGNITSDGGASVTARGVCWSISNNPTITDIKTSDGTGTGSFTSDLTGLSPNITYYVRAYATNSKGTSYGDIKSFITPKTNVSLTTVAVSSIGSNSAICGGNITADGGASITARGVCWSSTPTPTIANSKTSDGAGIGIFSSSLIGLSPALTYYVCAYAINSVGVSYGNILSFSTQKGLATISKVSTTNIGAGIATSGGIVTSDGGNTVTAYGVCWNTSPNPTIANSKTSDGSGIGSFISKLIDLNYSTTYYIRAYATNSAGTSYSTMDTITTTQLYVGDEYKGGKVAYILQSGDPGYSASVIHGLIVALSNQSTNSKWGCYNTLISGTSSNIGTGMANTTFIVSKCSETNCAAKICNDLIVGVYTDWYLPSKDELNKIYLNRNTIGGFTSDIFYSSTEYNSSYAWGQSFQNGAQGYSSGKLSANYVRAVRSF